jgi:hypothetical protein
MRSCVTPKGLLGISAASLKDFDNEISQIPNDACAPFNAAASRLEAELKQAYRFVASIARESEDLDDIAQLWTAMTSFCVALATTTTESLISGIPVNVSQISTLERIRCPGDSKSRATL